LSSVTLTDNPVCPGTFVNGDTNADNKLDPGEIWTYTCPAVINSDTTNTATVKGTPFIWRRCQQYRFRLCRCGGGRPEPDQECQITP